MRSAFVSIIIVTYNSDKYLQQCLKSVMANTYPNFEVLIVDNGSSDRTLQIAKQFTKDKRVRLLRSKQNLGYAGGNNLGLKKAKGQYVFFLNPDTTVSRSFLRPLVKKVESDSKIAAVQPAVYLLGDRRRLNLTGKVTHILGFDWLRDFQKTRLRKAGLVDSFSGSGVLIKKDVLRKIGSFDEDYFMYYEDSDLAWRMRLAGYKIAFESKSTIYHDYHFEPDEAYQPSAQKFYYAERNRLLTIFKNYQVKTLVLLFPIVFIMEVGMIAFSLFRGWPLAKVRGYGSILKLFPSLVVKRRKVQTLRVASDRQLLANAKSKIEYDLFRNPLIDYVANPVMFWYWQLVRPLI